MHESLLLRALDDHPMMLTKGLTACQCPIFDALTPFKDIQALTDFNLHENSLR